MTSTPLLGREAGRLAQGGTEPQGERPLHVPVPTRGDGSAVRTIRMEYVCPPPGPTLMVIEWVRQLGGRLVGMRTPRSIYLPSRGCYSYIYFIQRIFNFISRTCYAHACKFASWRARERELPGASPRKTPHVACCCVLCGCSRCSRSRVRCRVAMLSHAFAEVLARSCVWRLAKCFAEHCAKLSHGENLWLLCCWACVHHGRSVISRIAHRARMRERAGLRLLGGVCCVFVLLLVLCAIVGTQHSKQHSCVRAAAGVLPGRIATAMCARGGRIRFA